jgi:hypothetical protein
MDLAREFGVDREKEEKGVWLEVPPGSGGFWLMRRINNPEWRARVFKNLRTRRGRGRADAQDQETVDLIVNTALLDWRDILERGVELEFSKEEARRILLAYPDLIDGLFIAASDIEQYQSEADEAIREN